MQLAEKDKRGLLERNESFMQKRNEKLAQQLPTGVEECTFKPQILSSPRASVLARPHIVDRLYSYLDYYEQRRENSKYKLAA